MKSFKVLSLFAMSALVVGCAVPPVKTVTLVSKFDSAAAASQVEDGSGVIAGTAFLRQQGGGVVTCAGSQVLLYPASAYSRERLSALYGAAPQYGETKYLDIKRVPTTSLFTNDEPSYHSFTRKTVCDAQGNFTLEQVKDGGYYLVTQVRWVVGGGSNQTRQGGVLVAFVNVVNGKSARLIVTP